MKLITFTVPCYNSAEYMHVCIESLLKGGDKVEIVIINDGSKDNTGEVADRYQAQYPDIIKVVHQENGGHGEGINQGIRNATGKYFKVVDSDDWVGEDALNTLLSTIENTPDDKLPDLFVCNYVYYLKDTGVDKIIKYGSVFPAGKTVSWEETRRFGISQNLTLHSCMFKTSVMKENGLILPKHTFYEDNLYVYYSIPFAKKVCYMDVDFYYYLIGRDGQSVAKAAVMKRYEQQILVTTRCFEAHRLLEIRKTQPKLYRCLFHHLRLMMMLATLFARMNKTPKVDADNRAMWDHLMQVDAPLAKKLRWRTLNFWLNLPGKLGQHVCCFGYDFAHLFVKFN